MNSLDSRRNRCVQLLERVEEALESEKENRHTPLFKAVLDLYRDVISFSRNIGNLYEVHRKGRLEVVDLHDLAREIVHLEGVYTRLNS